MPHIDSSGLMVHKKLYSFTTILSHAEFLKTDHVIASKAETMVETIAHLDSVYGGAREYAKLIGLSDSEVSSIITNMKVADSA